MCTVYTTISFSISHNNNKNEPIGKLNQILYGSEHLKILLENRVHYICLNEMITRKTLLIPLYSISNHSLRGHCSFLIIFAHLPCSMLHSPIYLVFLFWVTPIEMLNALTFAKRRCSAATFWLSLSFIGLMEKFANIYYSNRSDDSS